MRTLRSLILAVGAAVTTVVLTLLPVASAQAHSLDSSTISLVLGENSASATVTVALETLDEALGTDFATSDTISDAGVATITAYLDEHLSVTGADGVAWAESYSNVSVADVEGIRSLSIDVAFDTGGSDPSSLSLWYEAIIEAVPGHEAVVVLTTADGEITTAGVVDAASTTLQIGDVASTGLLDMIGYGFRHVLEGADHLLFLVTLLLVAPLVAVGRRWLPRDGFRRSLRGVVGVATAFAIGHSITLLASALGWVSIPSAPVELLVAASVGVAAVHAIRPLVRRGDVVIAGVFGLVHGLAFAGILADLGFTGSLSVGPLLAFNVGVELAQLTTIAVVFPSIFLLSRTRFAPALRVGAAGIALVASAFWVLDRAGLVANPLSGLEDAVVAGSWVVAAGLAAAAGAAALHERRRHRRPVLPQVAPANRPIA